MRQAALVALAALAATIFGSGGLAAQYEATAIELAESGTVKATTHDCEGGVVYDDGTLNSIYELGSASGAAMRFELPAGTASLDQLCVCLVRSAGAPSTMNFEMVVQDDNGPGGGPGSLLISQPLSVPGISTTPGFFNFNLTGLTTPLPPDLSVFVGIRWPANYGPEKIYLCGDTSSALPQRTNFFSNNNGATWGPYATYFPSAPANNPRALGLRVDPRPEPTPCVPSATTMCLNNNRFKVEGTFAPSGQPLRAANTVRDGTDSGNLWFFSFNNTEVVVKVLDGCGVNNRYWVFSAGLTNVEVNLTVTDTAHPEVPPKTYHNPLNRPYPPVLDTDAFATCP